MKVKSGSFDEMAREIIMDNKKIVMFGAGVIGTVTAPEILSVYRLNPHVECYLDNDSRRWGSEVETRYGKKQVYPPQHLLELGSDIVILLTVSRYADALAQLERTGGLGDVSCYLIPVMCVMNFRREGGQGVAAESREPLIPKKIHYMWLGGGEIPEKLRRCLWSWKKYCPDYEIIRWDESNYDVGKHPYMRQAYERKKYGFVPDYARLDILYECGGIYMDTDVEVIRPLDELLFQQAFCGVEKWQVINFGGCSGAVKGHSSLRALMDAREQVDFIQADGSLNQTTCGYYDTRVMLDHGYKLNNTNQKVLGMNIYAYDYFHPYDYMSRRMDLTSDTYTIHHFNGGWLDEESKLANENTAREFEKLCETMSGRPEDVNGEEE